MAENYKHLYEVTKKMLAKYQDEVVPELRRLLDERVKVVRCEHCQWFKPAHFKADDGTEHYWGGSLCIEERTDGVYIGAKCKHERNTAYGEKDMAFRKPTDFCSYGERRESDDN